MRDREICDLLSIVERTRLREQNVPRREASTQTPRRLPRMRSDVASGGFSKARKTSLQAFLPPQVADETPIFWVVFRPKPRSVLRNRQGIPRLSGVSSRAHEGETRGG